MSIELDVKLPQLKLRRKNIIEIILNTWESLLLRDAAINIEDLALDNDEVVTGRCQSIEINVDERASVRCDFYSVDCEPDGPESGLWGVVAVGVRNAESALLMTVVALALAKAGECSAVDEAGILKRGEVLSISQVEQLTTIARGLSFSEAASAFASQIV